MVKKKMEWDMIDVWDELNSGKINDKNNIIKLKLIIGAKSRLIIFNPITGQKMTIRSPFRKKWIRELLQLIMDLGEFKESRYGDVYTDEVSMWTLLRNVDYPSKRQWGQFRKLMTFLGLEIPNPS